MKPLLSVSTVLDKCHLPVIAVLKPAAWNAWATVTVPFTTQALPFKVK